MWQVVKLEGFKIVTRVLEQSVGSRGGVMKDNKRPLAMTHSADEDNVSVPLSGDLSLDLGATWRSVHLATAADEMTRLWVPVLVDGSSAEALIDSGASFSMVTETRLQQQGISVECSY